MLSFNHVSMAVEGRLLFKELSLELKEQGRLCLTGPSGSGKTSVFRAILGILPFEGEITVNGISHTTANLKAIRNSIAYLSQTPFMTGETARESLLIPFAFAANKTDTPSEDTIRNALDAVGLEEEHLASHPDQLSGGEQQKLSVARAILMKRPIWLLDEITSALDGDSRQKVMDFLATHPATMLSISHDEAFIACQPEVLQLQDHHFQRVR